MKIDTHSIVQYVSHHKHLTDGTAASTGLGAAIMAFANSFLGFLQPVLAVILTGLSIWLVAIRIKIAKEERRRQNAETIRKQ